METVISKSKIQMRATPLDWQCPVVTAKMLSNSHAHMAFLYSGMQTEYSGRYSYLLWDLDAHVAAETFDALPPILSEDQGLFDNFWVGYLGYDLKNDLEALPEVQNAYLSFPKLSMMRFNRVICFDHQEQKAMLWTRDGLDPLFPEASSFECEKIQGIIPDVQFLDSSLSKSEYIASVEQILEKIKAGDLYQANLTRKSFGRFEEKPDPFVVFEKLSQVSPAPYSSFLKMGGQSILSSSPEQFLKLDSSGGVSSIPIKGSAPRGTTPEEDDRLRQYLESSAKDQSENLMIVDLMRHDFSKGSELGSVTVDPMFQVTAYETIHHMSSTIHAKKKESVSTLAFVKNTFPPGSMTGAPKVMAMKTCSELESLCRGVYSGAIGYFGGDGSLDLSVVIRTLCLEDDRFEFQVGGGIVAESDPKKEWDETCTKEKGILKTLALESKSCTIEK